MAPKLKREREIYKLAMHTDVNEIGLTKMLIVARYIITLLSVLNFKCI